MATPEKRSRGRPRSSDGPAQVAGVQSLERAMTVLEIVADSDGLSLTEVAEAANLPASTVYRILTTFQARRMVEFEETRQLWLIGVATFQMGSSFLRRRKLAEQGRGVMRRLQAQSGETANLAEMDFDGVVFISQIETHQPIRAFFRPGTRGDFHSSGIGKAILAHMDEGKARAMLEAAGLARYTPKTQTDLDLLAEDFRRIRDRGWSVDDEERNLGMRCVAAPIFNEYGEPVGGISISGPAVRVMEERDAAHGDMVTQAAREITKMIGGEWRGVGAVEDDEAGPAEDAAD